MKLTDCEIVGAHVTKRTILTDALTIMIADAARFSYKKRHRFHGDVTGMTRYLTQHLSHFLCPEKGAAPPAEQSAERYPWC